MKANGKSSAFDETIIAERTPYVQIDSAFGLRTTDVEVFTASGGSVTATNQGSGFEYICQTGTNQGGYGLVRSKNFLHCRPGQGAVARFSARFPSAGVASGAMRAGPVTTGTELSFGYNGTTFGVLYRTGGNIEVQTLTVSAGAGGNENVTVTLAGTAFVVAVTSGTATATAVQLGAATYTGWNVYQVGATVIFTATTVGDKTGTFSLSSTGTAAGTFAETQAGSAVTDTWIAQTAWNIDKMDGEGPSKMTLNVTKGNVYQIQWQYIGYGEIVYAIESPDGEFAPVHRIQFANNNTLPALLQGSMKIGWFAASLGSTTNLTLAGSAAAGFVEGKVVPLRNPFAYAVSVTGIGTTFTSVLALRNRPIFNGVVNIETLYMLLLNVAVEGTKPAICEVYLNPTFGTTQVWQYVDSTNAIAEYSTTQSTISGGQEIMTLGLSKSGQVSIPMKELLVRLARTETIAFALKATASTIDAVVSATWTSD